MDKTVVSGYSGAIKGNGGRVALLFLLFLLAIYEFVTAGFPVFAIICLLPAIVPIYPFGKWNTVEQFITNNQLLWYRESGYKNFYDTMTVAVNTLKRLDGSNINWYRSIWTNNLEMVSAKITDTAVVLDNGIKVGMTKEEVFKVIFKSYPKSYTSEINVLKVIAGAAEVGEIYTFKGNRLRHVQVISRYKYY